LHVVATDVMSGQEILLSTGDAGSAVVASAALLRSSLSVEREGRVHSHGRAHEDDHHDEPTPTVREHT